MITLAKIKRSDVVPCAPMRGNRLFASEAPDWMDSIAISKRPMGKMTLVRGRGEVLIDNECILIDQLCAL